MKSPNELYHPMQDEDEKIGSCRILTYALVLGIAVIAYVFIWCVMP